MKKIAYLSICMILFSFSSCRKEKQKAPSDCKGIAATLTNKTGLDGCQWMLLLEDSTLLEPTNLSAFEIELVEGKALCISYEETSVASICMAGTSVKLLRVQ